MSTRTLKSAVTLLALAAASFAEDQSPIKIVGTIQGAYSVTPVGRQGTSLGFLQDTTNHLRLTEATFDLNADWDRIGFHIDAGGGDFYKYAAAADSWQGPNRYISQAYIFGKPFGSLPVRVEAGKFFSSVGAEVPQGYQDFNTTRSLLFWYGSPLYHMGIRTSAPVTQTLSVGAQLLSGCNTITGSHGHQSMAFTSAYTAKHWGLAQIYMAGNEKFVGSGWRQLSDTVLTINPSSTVTAYIELLVAAEKRVIPGSDHWYGWATAWKISPTAKWSFSPRVEWFNDPDGATTGSRQSLAEFTLTGEYRPVKYAITRLEYRNEWSNRSLDYYGLGGLLPSRGQSIIAGVILMYQR
ncbi:MAG: outer membrane beta-barrel protein [Bryobacteraceae bacterium]